MRAIDVKMVWNEGSKKISSGFNFLVVTPLSLNLTQSSRHWIITKGYLKVILKLT